MKKLRKFVAKFDKAGKFADATKSSEREITYWAYSLDGAKASFDKEKVAYKIVYPR